MRINLAILLAFSSAVSELMARECNDHTLENYHFDDLLKVLKKISVLDVIDNDQRLLCQKAMEDIGIKQAKLLSLVDTEIESESSTISQVEIEAHELIHEEYAEVVKEYMLDRADIYDLSRRASELQSMLPLHLRTLTALMNSPVWKKADEQEVSVNSIEKIVAEIEQLNPDNYETSLALRRSIAGCECKNLEALERCLPINKQKEVTLLLDKSIQESGNIFRSSFQKYQNTRRNWRGQLTTFGISEKYLSAIDTIRDHYLHSNEIFPGSMEKATTVVKENATLRLNNLSSLLKSPEKMTSEHKALFDKLSSAQKAYVVENGLCVMAPKMGIQTYLPMRIYPHRSESATSAFMFKREGGDRSTIYFFNQGMLAGLSGDEIKKIRKETEKPLQERKHFPIKVTISPIVAETKKNISRGIR